MIHKKETEGNASCDPRAKTQSRRDRVLSFIQTNIKALCVSAALRENHWHALAKLQSRRDRVLSFIQTNIKALCVSAALRKNPWHAL
jgi:hypothetical protein